jgi:hypothetical protein
MLIFIAMLLERETSILVSWLPFLEDLLSRQLNHSCHHHSQHRNIKATLSRPTSNDGEFTYLPRRIPTDRLIPPPRLEAMTEEEQERHQHRLRAYDAEIQNLIWATSLLIKCTAFYVAVKGVQAFRTTF